MRSRASSLAVAAHAALCAFLAASPARADITKDQCVEANAKAQDLLRDGRLLSATSELHMCAVSACPALIRDDCTRRLDEVVRAQPSFIFDVKDASGVDLIDVRVSMDGQALTERLDGKPLKVDPGVHTFTFEVAGRAPINRRLLVKEGEAARQEHVVFKGPVVLAPPPPVAPVAAATPPVIEPPPTSSTGLRGGQVAGLAIGIAGVVGIGVGATFGILASSEWSKTKTLCGGNAGDCASSAIPGATSDRSTTVTDATVSTIGFVAGGALVVGGAVLLFTGGKKTEATVAGLTLTPDVGRGQAGLVVRGGF